MSGLKGKSGRKPRPVSEKGKPWSKPKGAIAKNKKPKERVSMRLSPAALAARSALAKHWSTTGTGAVEKALLSNVESWRVKTPGGDEIFWDWKAAFGFSSSNEYPDPEPVLIYN